LRIRALSKMTPLDSMQSERRLILQHRRTQHQRHRFRSCQWNSFYCTLPQHKLL